jgi:raffinose/stachyose/melibiose transport system permease protein
VAVVPDTLRERMVADDREAAPYAGQPPRRPKRRAPYGHMAIFVAPAFVVYTLFMVWPLLDSLRLSLFSDTGEWVGLGNFRTLFGNELFADRFWGALENNFVFFAFHCLIQNPVALLLAVFLTAHGVRGQSIYRTLIFTPTVLSVVVIGFIWKLLLSPLWAPLGGVSEAALLGDTQMTLPVLGIEFHTALPTLSLISVWQWVGIPMIFFYAVLIAIPQDLIEASRVDGSGALRTFRHVTLPLILPMLGIITIVTYVMNFNAFDLIYTVQGALAGPEFATDIMGTLFYRSFFGFQLEQGSSALGATVASAMFLIILFGILAYTFAWQRRVRTYEL